ncbi:MAG TPA: hypothetical protein PLM07_02800 [Candidatus Rifleibacterium sp.]|nr:hypothetical protein [Candidatus Rifleibacterium sp.]HPT44813.1 hypothetical protein [Candidatus Rifleibacterium sp.]
MKSQQKFSEIIEQLAGLTEGEGEYFSHQTALYLLGLQSEPPATLTIVADRRRRNRRLGSFELVFVYHGKEEASGTQTVVFMEKHLRVSTIEKTLIDLTKDCTYAPPILETADLFCRVSFNLKMLLNIARQTSDSVLKRVSLYLAWSGRLTYADLPLKLFKRTPVKLDPREEDRLLWNGLFNCRLPIKLLQHCPAPPPADVDRETSLWMELKRLPEFCEKQAAAGMVFIRESPEPRSKAIIENFFVEIFRGLGHEKLVWLLDNVLNSLEQPDFPPLIPRMLVSFISSRTDVLALRHEEIRAWLNVSLPSSDIRRAEAAIFIGALMGLDEDVIARFETISQQLFYAGRFQIINFMAEHYLARGIKLAHTAYIDISKTFSAQERFDDALSLLEDAKLLYENTPGNAMGSLFFATSLVLKRLNRDDEALAELFLAREAFTIENDPAGLARSENSLGNLYFSRGHAQAAKTHYHAGLHLARRHKLQTQLPSFMTNLGLVEFDTGNFAGARLQLSRAYSLYKSQNNHWSASVAGMGLGKLFLKLGYLFKAMKIFREVLVIREEKKNLSGIYEIYSLLAWICELLGKTAAARTWHNNAENIRKQQSLEPRVCHVGESLLAMSHVFNNRFHEAENQYRKMYSDSLARSSTGVQFGDLQYGLGATLLFQGRNSEAYNCFLDARKNIGTEEARIQRTQLLIMVSLYFPESSIAVNLDSQLERFLATGCFDPFWAHISKKLLEFGSPAAIEYLKFHINRTPPVMMKHLTSHFKHLAAAVIKFQPGGNRSSEFLTMISRDNTRTLHYDEYLAWKKERPDGILIFDAFAGMLIYSGNTARIKAGSIPGSVLQQLFMAQPYPISISTLYSSAWGTEYDPEFDYGAFKSTLQRLKKQLQSLSPSTRISTGKIRGDTHGVKLSLAVPWMLISK